LRPKRERVQLGLRNFFVDERLEDRGIGRTQMRDLEKNQNQPSTTA
jgi:hypothetical protein